MAALALTFALAAAARERSAAGAPPLPETDWLSGKHGVFTHFLDSLQNRGGRNSQGQNTTWDETVRSFDVEAYAESAAATGASYAFITIMQGDRYMIAPNAAFDNFTGFAPGEACATRDLVLDLIDALSKRGLKLMLYYTGDGPARDPVAAKGMDFNPGPRGINEGFVSRWAAVLREYAVRYGDKVSGWWIDGCYAFAELEYNDTLLKYYHDAIRAGNPDAVLGFNNGVHHPIANPIPWSAGGEVSAWEDMTCGESNDFSDVPASRWVTGPVVYGGPDVTVQWHSLGFLGSQWAAPGTCVCSKFANNCSDPICTPLSAQEVKLYTQSVNAVGGALTVDLQLLRNGSMNRDQVQALAAAWTTPWACAADHGKTTCCCGQDVKCDPGGPVPPGKQCPAATPVCSGFVYGTAYGTCVAAATDSADE